MFILHSNYKSSQSFKLCCTLWFIKEFYYPLHFFKFLWGYLHVPPRYLYHIKNLKIKSPRPYAYHLYNINVYVRRLSNIVYISVEIILIFQVHFKFFIEKLSYFCLTNNQLTTRRCFLTILLFLNACVCHVPAYTYIGYVHAHIYVEAISLLCNVGKQEQQTSLLREGFSLA